MLPEPPALRTAPEVRDEPLLGTSTSAGASPFFDKNDTGRFPTIPIISRGGHLEWIPIQRFSQVCNWCLSDWRE